MSARVTAGKVLLYVVIAFLALFAIIAFLFLEPHMNYRFERKDSQPIEFVAEYQNLTGDPICSKLYSLEPEIFEGSVLPRFPLGVPDPHAMDLEFGTKIKLVGYRYFWVSENLITGKLEKRSTSLFSIVRWSSGADLNFFAGSFDLSEAEFHSDNYTVCK